MLRMLMTVASTLVLTGCAQLGPRCRGVFPGQLADSLIDDAIRSLEGIRTYQDDAKVTWMAFGADEAATVLEETSCPAAIDVGQKFKLRLPQVELTFDGQRLVLYEPARNCFAVRDGVQWMEAVLSQPISGFIRREPYAPLLLLARNKREAFEKLFCDLRLERREDLSAEPCWVLSGYTRNVFGQGKRRVTLWVRCDDGILRRVWVSIASSINQSGAELPSAFGHPKKPGHLVYYEVAGVLFDFAGIRLNAPLNDEIFRPQVPTGATEDSKVLEKDWYPALKLIRRESR